MKRGIILYITGNEPDDFTENSQKIIDRMELGADSVEMISACSGHFDIHEATWSLMSRGMQKIECMIAGFTNSGNLKLTGHILRLCG